MSNESTNRSSEPPQEESRHSASEFQRGLSKSIVLPSASQPAGPPVASAKEQSPPVEEPDLPVSKAVVLPSAQKLVESPKDDGKQW